MKRILTLSILALAAILAPIIHSQSSGSTPPPPPYCTSANAGALYTNTGTSPATVYTCSYYNLAWQWVVNPSYGGLVYYPTVPTTCSGSLPVFLAGWPTNTQMYVCVNGVPVPQAIGPPGPVGPSGPPINWRGSWAAYTPYARNDGFVEAGIGYVVITSYTSGATFGSLDTGNSVQITTGCAGGVCLIAQGGTGATTAAGALTNLGGQPVSYTGTTDPPSQTCTASPAVNQGIYATSTTDKLYQCLNGVWEGLVTSRVSQIIAGSNVTISPPEGTGAVTVNSGSGLSALNFTPPISGQYVFLKADVGQGWISGGNTSYSYSPGSCFIALLSPSAWVNYASCAFSIPALPSYVDPANITAIYGAYSNSFGGDAVSSVSPSSINDGRQHNWLISSDSSGLSYDCDTWIGQNRGNGASLYEYMAFYIYYTGTAPTNPSGTSVVYPLSYDETANTLSLIQPYDYANDLGLVNHVHITSPAYPPGSILTGYEVKFKANYTNTITTPDLAFNDTEGPIQITKCGQVSLAAGDYTTTGVADVIFNRTYWELQNPVSGCGSGGTYSLPIATTSTLGGVKPDGTSCTVNGTTGVLTCIGTGGGGDLLSNKVVYASKGNSSLGLSACAVNSSLISGGGTDDTSCLQTILDTLYTNYGGGTLVQDGASLISGTLQTSSHPSCLQIHSNETIVGVGGASGYYLADSSNCTMIANNVQGNPAASFEINMDLENLTLNGNSSNQSQYEQGLNTNGWIMGVWFGGFKNVTAKNITFHNIKTFSLTVSNGNGFTVSNETVIQDVPASYQDTLHMWGPLATGYVENIFSNGGDDVLAFNTDEGVAIYNGDEPDHNYANGSGWGSSRNRYPNSGGNIYNVFVEATSFNNSGRGVRFIGGSTFGGTSLITNIVIRDTVGNITTDNMHNDNCTITNLTIDGWHVFTRNTLNLINATGVFLHNIDPAAPIILDSIEVVNNNSFLSSYIFNTTDTSDSPNVASFLASNVSANSTLGVGPSVWIGRSASTNNLASMNFNYKGSGNSDNSIQFGIYGTAPSMLVYKNAVAIGSSARPQANGLTVGGAISNGVSTATNSDNHGQITLVAGTGSYTFTQGPGSGGAWTTSPVCLIQDDTTLANIGTSTKTVSATTLTITGSVGTTDTYSYICWPGN